MDGGTEVEKGNEWRNWYTLEETGRNCRSVLSRESSTVVENRKGRRG